MGNLTNWLSRAAPLAFARPYWPQGALVAAFVIAAVGSVVLVGGWPALLTLGVGAVAIARATHALAPAGDRRFVLTVLLAALGGRALLASIVHVYLVMSGRPLGEFFLDDATYVGLAMSIAASWRGDGIPLGVNTDAVGNTPVTFVTNYVILAAALFWAIGPSVLALKLLNSTFAVATALLAYRTTLLIGSRFSARVALIAVAVFPSLVLWSISTLKEAFVVCLMLCVVWMVAEFAQRPSYVRALATAAVIAPLANTRDFLHFLLAGIWLIVVASWAGLRGRWAQGPSLLAAALALVLLATGPVNRLSPQVFENLDLMRQNMAEGARSAIVQRTNVVEGLEGRRFLIAIPGVTSPPGRTPRVIEVPVGAVVSQRDDVAVVTWQGSGKGIVAYPNDVIVIRRPAGTASPQSTPQAAVPLEVPAGGVVVAEDPVSTRILRTIQFLPRGVLHLLFAPFPWEFRAPSELPLLIELGAWYVTMVFALLGLATLARRRVWQASYAVLVAVAIAGVLSVAEGNVGALFRHRSMLIPLVAIFAGIGVDSYVRSRSADRLASLRSALSSSTADRS